MNQTFETIRVDLTQHDGVCASLTISRETSLNALSRLVLNEIDQFLQFLKTQSQIRLLIVRGAGEKAFVAGADISEMCEMDSKQAMDFALLGQRVFQEIENLPCVTMAVVHGFALGGGLELAMACDLMMVTEKARVGQPEVGLGLIPGFGGTQRLIERVGSPVAMAMLLAGKNLEGEEIVRHGLASDFVASADLEGSVSSITKKVLRAGPHANSLCKRVARHAREMSLSAGLFAEASAFSSLFESGETKEGLTAFLQKRSASFVKKC